MIDHISIAELLRVIRNDETDPLRLTVLYDAISSIELAGQIESRNEILANALHERADEIGRLRTELFGLRMETAPAYLFYVRDTVLDSVAREDVVDFIMDQLECCTRDEAEQYYEKWYINQEDEA
jgi:hypothetical protein